MGLMRADHLFLHNYIRSLLNNIIRPIIIILKRLESASFCLCVRRFSQLSYTGSYIYIYIIYIYITSTFNSK